MEIDRTFRKSIIY